MKRKQFSLRLPETLIDEIDRLAEMETRDRTNYIEHVLTRHVDRKRQGLDDDGSNIKEMIGLLHDQIAKISDEKTRRNLTLRLLTASMQLNDYINPNVTTSMGIAALFDIQREVFEHLGSNDSEPGAINYPES